MTAEGVRRATLRWGIVLGVVTVLAPLLIQPVIANFGTQSLAGGTNAGPLLFTLLLTTLPSVLGLFSAALVAASLVMRHAQLLAPAVAPSSGPLPTE